MLGALLVGVIVAALAGLVIGYLTLRRTGIYFAMSTLAFGEMFYFLENSLFKEYTGGENGIAGVPPPEIALGFVTINISSGWPMESEERRVGKEWFSTSRSRWLRYTQKKKKQ